MTDVELWTAAGAGGVAVIVLRGEGAGRRLARLGVAAAEPAEPTEPTEPGGPGAQRPPARLVHLSDGDEDLDEALLVGADGRLELHLHGSPPLVARVLALLGEPQAGEPAASSGGLAERAWQRLGQAPSELGARILLDQAQGALGAALERLSGLPPAQLPAAALELIERGRVARFLFERSTVALVGPVNAGKSTLFNLLLGSERTLVSSELGTTRDAISEAGQLGPWPVLLVDTAGQRTLPSGDVRHAVEREGQRLARAVGREADWVLPLARASDAGADAAAAASLLTCCDELGSDPQRWPAGGISARDRPGRALARVRELFQERFQLPADQAGLWSPGRAVPFEEGQVRALEALRRAAREPASAGPLGDALQSLLDLAR